MLIPSVLELMHQENPSLSRRVNANSQLVDGHEGAQTKLIKKGEC